MSRSRSSPKKEYLLGKMFDGAVAMYDFFETARNNKDVDYVEVADGLKREHRLTESQGKYLDGVVERAGKARSIVRYLERRFGMDDEGNFKDAQGLHKLLFDNNTPKRIEAKSYNFGVGFVQGVWRDDKAMGYKHIRVWENNCLDASLKKSVSWLERGVDTNCRTLAFRIPGDHWMAKYAENRKNGMTEESKLLASFFGDRGTTTEGMKDEVINHELRHVMDAIINGQLHCFDFFQETPAHLYEGGNRDLAGIRRDFEREKKAAQTRVDDAEAKMKEYSTGDHSDTVVGNQTRILARRRKYLEGLGADAPRQQKLFGNFIKNELPVGWDLKNRPKGPVLSYLFSMMDKDKAEKRIGEVVTHLRSWRK